ncbi:MAG: GNAT family N-acetyltransferase [Anaerolineales bacterium]|nr:MAG: GNAT family N-acetyltransferase [Anaerolineales bacterium]
MALSIESRRAVHDFDVLAGEWNDLLRRSAADTIFLTHEYQRVWWEHLGEGDLALVALRDGRELVGIAPLFAACDGSGSTVLRTVGCVEVSDYLDLIAAPDREPEVYQALVDFLESDGAPAWDSLDLCNIREDSPTLALLPPLAEARGWSVSVARDEVCPVIQLPSSWDEYLAGLPGKERREIGRKLRRAEGEMEAHWYIVGAEHDLAAEVEDFLGLMAASSPDKAEFLTPRMRGFFRALAAVAHEQGWLQLAFLQVGGTKVAAYFNFVYNNRVLVYNSGLDWNTFPQLSGGHVLIAYCIRHAIEEGREVFDFLRGSERYKYQFGGQDVEVRRLTVRRRRF